MDSADVKERLRAMAWKAAGAHPEQFTAFVEAEAKLYARLVKSPGRSRIKSPRRSALPAVLLADQAVDDEQRVGGYLPSGNIFGNSRSRQAMNFGMSCECTR